MKLSLFSRSTLVAAMCAALSQHAIAANSFDDVQYWVGSGSNRAAFVMDWNDGKTAESLIWGFRWDGVATGETMLTAIVQADPRFYAHVSAPGMFGVALNGAGYDLDNDGFGVTPALSFDAGGLSVGTADDDRVATDADDHYVEGAFTNGYWGYWVGGTGSSAVWTSSMTGMTGRTLTNNSWDGWSFAANFVDVSPSDAVAAVPEPATLAVFGLGSLLTRRRR